MRIAIVFVCISFFAFVSNAQEFDRAKMDDLFSLISEHEQGMGSFSLYKEGKEVYTNTFGVLDVKGLKKADGNSAYRIGSISKTFTACIIMKLVEDKKLKLSTPLTRFFPKVKNSSRITIELMLRHRSGIYNFTNTDEYLSFMEKPLSREELVGKVIEFGSAFEPDEESGYSNSNYVLLSIIAEKVTKKPFDVLIKEMIAEPLGLKHTYVGAKINPTKNEANSFKKMKSWEATTETDMSIPLGAGAIVSTPKDMNNFWKHFYNNEIVSEASREKMMQIKDGYGMGLFQIPFNDKKAFGHNGGIDGFQSMSYHFPQENVSISYLSNAVVYPVNDLMIDALSIYFGKEKALPEFLPVMEIKEEDLAQYTGVYTSPDIPISLTISHEGKQLMGQGTGQPAFPLDAFDTHKFKFDPAKIEVQFFPKVGRVIMSQGGKSYEMKKEM